MDKDSQMDSKCALADPALGGRDQQYETLKFRKATAELVVFFLGITHVRDSTYFV
jgi:hypothetical protein